MPGGRDQLGPLERVTRVLLALEAAEPVGVAMPRLLEIADFGGAETHQARQLKRDLDSLNAAGWDIRNVAPPGETAVYRVRARDNRLRVELTPEQQGELARAAEVAGDPEFTERLGVDPAGGEPGGDVRTQYPRAAAQDTLDKALHALAHHCLVRFTYKQRARVVHPHGVFAGASGWYLVGNEDGSDVAKQFVTDRMSDVSLDRPGTAIAPADPRRNQLNPLTWEVDPPTDVVVRTAASYAGQVEEMLGTATHREPAADHGDDVLLTVPVTNRAAFRARVYELGLRVHVVGPDDVRAELLAALEAIAGERR